MGRSSWGGRRGEVVMGRSSWGGRPGKVVVGRWEKTHCELFSPFSTPPGGRFSISLLAMPA